MEYEEGVWYSDKSTVFCVEYAGGKGTRHIMRNRISMFVSGSVGVAGAETEDLAVKIADLLNQDKAAQLSNPTT